MLKTALIIALVVMPCMAIQFPVAPKGQCYDGCHKLIEENAYPGAIIAYNSHMGDGQGHVWLLAGGKVIDAYYGEMSPKTAGYQAEATFQTWEDFESSLHTIDVTNL